jgi:hypothetical protein
MPDMKSAAKAEKDARWREADVLRKNNPGWIVLWLDGLRLFRAYKIVSRNKTQVEAATAAELQEKLTAAQRGRAAPAPADAEPDSTAR